MTLSTREVSSGYNEVGNGLKNIEHFENDYTVIGAGLLGFRCRRLDADSA